MSLRTRYLFYKKLYPNRLVLFFKNGEYICYGKEKIVLKICHSFDFLDTFHIMYVIVDYEVNFKT